MDVYFWEHFPYFLYKIMVSKRFHENTVYGKLDVFWYQNPYWRYDDRPKVRETVQNRARPAKSAPEVSVINTRNVPRHI